MRRLIIGITGASGSIYFKRLVDQLLSGEYELHLVASEHGSQVYEYEIGKSLREQVQEWQKVNENIILENNDNLFSPIASGSYKCESMVVIPCSMSTAAEISNGITKTLLTRAADVMLKEDRKLLLVPRETPFSTNHLKNLYELSKLGAAILPAMPGFYNHPQTLEEAVDFVVGKVLDNLKIENTCYKRWEGRNKDEK